MNKDWVDDLNVSIKLSTGAIKELREAIEETRSPILCAQLAVIGELLLESHAQVLAAVKKIVAQSQQGQA